jgi:integrase
MDELSQHHYYFTENQINDLRDACHEHLRPGYADRMEAMIVTQADLGLRPGELCLIETNHIDYDEGAVFLPAENQKGNYSSDARVEIDPLNIWRTERVLRRYSRTDWFQKKTPDNTNEPEFFFPTRQSPRVQPGSYREALRSLAEKADIAPKSTDMREDTSPSDSRPHLLRHSVANYFIDHAQSLETVSRRLRHSRIETTERYYAHFQMV